MHPTNPHLTQLFEDLLLFLSYGEHEIVALDSPSDHSQETAFLGFHSAWTEERDQLLRRLQAVLPQENQFYLLCTDEGKALPPTGLSLEEGTYFLSPHILTVPQREGE